jgi:isocitrate lyase
MAVLKPLSDPISYPFASDSFQLLPESEKPGAAEDELYELQIRDCEAWWATPRYEGIKRPYSAADVVSKRGSQMQSYPSSLMARKLFNLLKEREARGEPVHTSEYLKLSSDPTDMIQWERLTQFK